MSDEPCQTCNDDPEVCASVPGLRHCEKALRAAADLIEPETDPDWYANYRREVEAAYAIRKKMEAEFMAFAAKAELERSARQWALFTAQQNTRLP